MRKWHVVAYDVCDDRRLRRVAQVLCGYGERLQYSVFRCRLNAVELERLLWELESILAKEDRPSCHATVPAVRGGDPWAQSCRVLGDSTAVSDCVATRDIQASPCGGTNSALSRVYKSWLKGGA
jgi:hypothetical protein